MPRDGSGIYTQPFPDVATDTTIESAVYNGFVADVATDLNTPRPVIAGGTGANNALDAMITLGGEIAEQLVTNYNDFPFQTGSFRSAGSATGGPVDTHAFVGIVYKSDDANMVLEARDQADTAVPGTKYIREKKAGVWSAWVSEDADIAADIADIVAAVDADIAALDADKVDRAGDTMTGNLTISAASGNATLAIKVANQVDQALVNFMEGAAVKWSLGKQSNNTFFIYDAANAKTALSLDHTSGGKVSVDYPTMRVGTGGTTATYYFGNTDTKHLNYNGVSFTFTGGALNVATGSVNIGNGGIGIADGSSAIDWGFSSFIRRVAADGSMEISTQNGILYTPNVRAVAYGCKPGTAGAFVGNLFNINFTSGAQLWIDATNLGTISVTSDYRTKKDVIELPGMWDTVKALRPIKYTQAQFHPPVEVAADAARLEKDATFVPTPLFKADDVERWGFVAHELQETLTPSAATGVKDSPDTIQSPNPFTLIAALTKALQEAMARIEALEAAT